jgi:hypothetical protein
MDDYLIPVFLLAISVALALGLRPQLFGNRIARWLLGGACVLAVGLSLPLPSHFSLGWGSSWRSPVGAV